ncbi:MAG: hypothetical protein U0441_23160 [Polyangiaceae bacterium]
MKRYDMTFVFSNLDPRDEVQRRNLETLLGTTVEERDSLYNGGTYYRSVSDSRQKVMLRPNLDLLDMVSFYPEHPKEAWILSCETGSPRDLEATLRAAFPGVVLYRERECQPPASPVDEKGKKLRVIVAAMPNFTPEQITVLGSALRLTFEEAHDAMFGGRHFSARDLAGQKAEVFANFDNDGEPDYPEAPLGTWLVGFYPTSRTPEEISQVLTSLVDPAAHVIRAPKNG